MQTKIIMTATGLLEVPEWCENMEGAWREATPEEIAVHQAALLEFKAKAPTWEQQRRAAYPDWQIMADALVEERAGNPEKMAAYLEACADVKRRFPKPKE